MEVYNPQLATLAGILLSVAGGWLAYFSHKNRHLPGGGFFMTLLGIVWLVFGIMLIFA